jgi:hypothetical protein
MAGAGVKRVLDKGAEMSAQYRGRVADWTLQSTGHIPVRGLGGLEGNLQVHYFENAVIGVRTWFHSS